MIELVYWLLNFLLLIVEFWWFLSGPPGPWPRWVGSPHCHIDGSCFPSLNLLLWSIIFGLELSRDEMYRFCSAKKSRNEHAQNFSSRQEHCPISSLVWFKFDWFLCATCRRSLSHSSVFCMLIFLERLDRKWPERQWQWPHWQDGGGCSCSLDGHVWVGEEPGVRASGDLVGQLQSDSGSSLGRFCERPPFTAHLHHLKQVRRAGPPQPAAAPEPDKLFISLK